VIGQRVADPQTARLQALLPLVPTSRPRITPARPRELTPLARIVATLTGRLTGSGPPNIFTTLGRHPRLFRAWLWYSAHLMPFGRLPRPDTELLILRIGLTSEQIQAIAATDSSNALTGRQRALLALSDDLLAQRAMSESTWHSARAHLTERDAIEACLLVGHYQGLASAIGGLAIEPEDRNQTHGTDGDGG
jgi:alkylhydroperoxidase family enzyme